MYEEPPSENPLRVKKDHEPRNFKVIEDEATTPPPEPLFKEVKKTEGFNWLGLTVPVVVLALLVAGGRFGYQKMNEQNARLTTAIREAAEAEQEVYGLRNRIDTLKGDLRDLDNRRRDTLGRSGPEAVAKAAEEVRVDIDKIRQAVLDTRRDAETDRAKRESEASSRREELKRRLEETRRKVDAAYDDNVAMKSFLNVNNRTMHSNYRIEPRP